MNVKRPMDGVDSLGMNQALSLGMAKLGMNWEVVIVQSLVSSFVYLVIITSCFICCLYMSDLTSLTLSLSHSFFSDNPAAGIDAWELGGCPETVTTVFPNEDYDAGSIVSKDGIVYECMAYVSNCCMLSSS